MRPCSICLYVYHCKTKQKIADFMDFQDFQKFNENRILMEANFEILIIHKPSLDSLDVPQKIWARSVQPFWRLLDTNIQTPRQAKFIYRFIDHFYFKAVSVKQKKGIKNQMKMMLHYLLLQGLLFFYFLNNSGIF